MPIPWTALTIWAISSALYWLIPDDKKEIERPMAETPYTKEGILFPVFWGTATITPVNVKFSLKSQESAGTLFYMQDVICLGYIERFFGSFIGGKATPYGYEGPNAPQGIRHFNSEYQPYKFRNTKKYEIMRIFNTNWVSDDMGIDGWQPRLIIDYWVSINNMMAECFLGMGVDNDNLDHPYPNDNHFPLVFFSDDKFEDETDYPMWNYLTIITSIGTYIGSSVPARQYKVQRLSQNLIGDDFPLVDIEGVPTNIAKIFNFKQIIPEFRYSENYQPYVRDFNICFSQSSTNPMFIIKDILTSPLLTMKLPESIIDTEDFEKCAIALYNENFGMNVILDSRSTDSEDVLLQIMSYIKGFMYLNLDDGKIHFTLSRADYDFDLLDVIDDDTITEIEDYTNEIDGRDCPNSVTVKFINRFTNKDYQWMIRDLFFGYDTEKEVTVKNDEDIALRGLFEEKIRRVWVSDPDRAYEIAEDYLFMSSAKLTKLKIIGNSLLNKYHEGDVIRLKVEKKGINDVAFRVFAKSVGKVEDGIVSLSLIEDIHSIKYGSYTSIPDEYGLDPIVDFRITKPSLWEMFNSTGNQDITDFIGTIPYRFSINKNNPTQIAYDIYFKTISESVYQLDTYKSTIPIGVSMVFTLTENISSFINIKLSQNEFLDVSDGDVFMIGSEIIKKSGEFFERGCYDTNTTYHLIGETCISILQTSEVTAVTDVRNFVAAASENYQAKIATVSGAVTINLDKCIVNVLESNLTARYQKPLNCTGIKINQIMYYYESINIIIESDTNIVISWTNKDRNNCSAQHSDGIRSIYDDVDYYNILEENCSYIIEFMDSNDVVFKTVLIPYSTQSPTLANTQYGYPYQTFVIDYPDLRAKFRIKARRQIAWSPDEFIYSEVDRVVEFTLIPIDLVRPRNWFLYRRADTLNDGYAYSFMNIFYPPCEGVPVLFTTYNIDDLTPPYPEDFSTPDSLIGRIIPTTGIFSVSDILAKTWMSRTRAIAEGVWYDEIVTRQAIEYFPPYCAIRKLTDLHKEIYVGSNTDYWSDWFDTTFTYELYMVYTYARIAGGSTPTKNPNEYPQLPLWSFNIEDDKVDRYLQTDVEIPAGAQGDSVAIFARAKAKLTRIDDDEVSWTKDYFVKSWKVVTKPSWFAYKSLRTFPAPIIVIEETHTTIPSRWHYRISITVPSGAEWENENWEWRLRYQYSTTHPPVQDFNVDPNNEFVLTNVAELELICNTRLVYLDIIVDIILNRTTDTIDRPVAIISPQAHKRELFT